MLMEIGLEMLLGVQVSVLLMKLLLVVQRFVNLMLLITFLGWKRLLLEELKGLVKTISRRLIQRKCEGPAWRLSFSSGGNLLAVSSAGPNSENIVEIYKVIIIS